MLAHYVAFPATNAVQRLKEAINLSLSSIGVELDEPLGSETHGDTSFILRSVTEDPAAIELVAEGQLFGGRRSRTVASAVELARHGWIVLEHEQGAESGELDPCPDLLWALISALDAEPGGLTLGNQAVEISNEDDFESLRGRLRSCTVPLVVVVDDVGGCRPLLEVIQRQIGPLVHHLVFDRALIEMSTLVPDALASLRPFGTAVMTWEGQEFRVDQRNVVPSEVGRRQPVATARRLQRLCVQTTQSFPPASDVALLRKRIASIRPAGSVEELTLWEEEVERLTALTDELRTEQSDWRSKYQDLVIELEIVEKEKDQLARSYRFLERRVLEMHQTVWDDVEEEDEFEPLEINSSVEALALAREHLPFVSISVDVDKKAAELDEDPRSGLFGQRCWEALRALDHYGRAKRESRIGGDFRSYCSDAPPGFAAISAQGVSMHESESTMGNPTLRGQRVFPVSRELDPSGTMLMDAHIRLKQVGSVAPRLYFLDDTSGSTGKVHIGYVGHHLETAG